MLLNIQKFIPFCLLPLLLIGPAVSAQDHKRCDINAAVLEVAEGLVEVQVGGAEWQSVNEGFELCYGDALRVVESRASVRLENNTLVRLKEDSLVKFIAPKASFWVELAQGAAHFISRTPKAFEVTSPYLNAAVDGTEFIVTVQDKSSQIYVVEGQVTANNQYGALPLLSNQAAVAYEGQQPKFDVNIKLVDSVGWAFQYPLLSNLFDGVSENLQQLIRAGNYTTALQAIEQQPISVTELQRLNLITALNLSVGKVDAALKVNAKALSLAPKSAEANAAYTLMLLTRGQKDVAVKRSVQALALHPNNTSVLLTDSFVQQAQFNLNDALQSAMAAAELLPTSAGLWLRVAELQLNLNDVKSANDALQKAKAINTSSERLATLQGVIDLKALRFKAAKKQFEHAIAIDNRQPLAHFLLGLTQIRLGKQDVGRQQVELAVLLDPNNSLYRSYLGKIYYDEFRFEKAVDQFNLAKQLDPQDPTPYFYQAIQYQALGRPTDAIVEIQESIVRNDNRAVYRSRMQLDSDYGARSASLADVYLDLGITEQAINEAEKAKRISPNEFSPYKIMADIRGREPRSTRAAASEYLQAQMRQPLTSTPIRPLLAEVGMLLLPGAGPSSLGLSEYNSLMSKNENLFLLSGAAGSENTTSYSAMASGLIGQQSYLLESFSNESEGVYGDNEIDYVVNTAFYQVMPSESMSVFFEYKSKEEAFYEEQLGFETSIAENDLEVDSARLGASYQLSENIELFATGLYRDDQVLDTDIIIWDRSTPDEYVYLVQEALSMKKVDLEVLTSWNFRSIRGLLGVQKNTFTGEFHEQQSTYAVGFEPEIFLDENGDRDVEFKKYYAYFSADINDQLSLELGVSDMHYDDAQLVSKNIHNTAKKFGLKVLPTDWFRVDLVYFENLASPGYGEQTLEKTHILGINQFFDDTGGSESETLALSISGRHWGWNFDVDSYDRDVSSFIVGNDKKDFYRERNSVIRMGKIFNGVVFDVSVDVSSIDFKRWPESSTPYELDTKAIPLKIGYFSSIGFSFEGTLSRVFQRTAFDVSQTDFPVEEEQFTVLDLSVSYLWRSKLLVSLDVKNALEEQLTYRNPIYSDTSASLRNGYFNRRVAVGRISWMF